jgi:hypothetical protein
MLQVLHLDISKVDQVLHKSCAWKTEGCANGPCADDVQVARAPVWARVTQAQSNEVRATWAHTWTHVKRRGELTVVTGVRTWTSGR